MIALFPGAFVLSSLLSYHGLRKGSLDRSGALAAFAVGYLSLANSLKCALRSIARLLRSNWTLFDSPVPDMNSLRHSHALLLFCWVQSNKGGLIRNVKRAASDVAVLE